jgi:Mrp family chromosome partitioning ATPase/capsular polysaccharide biosynthesis protein
MELSAYIRLVRRWLWLIVLAAVVAGSASFAATRTQTPLYQASTTIQVGTYSTMSNPDSSMIYTSGQLAQTYVALAKTYPVLNGVVEKLQLPMSANSLAGIFQVRLITNTSLMSITVTYTDPVMASDIANELAAQLIANSPTELSKEQEAQLTLLRDEVKQAQAQLQAARDELKTVEDGLKTATGQDLAVLTDRRDELLKEITTTQGNLASISNTVAMLQQRGNVNTLRIVEQSQIPSGPINSSSFSTVLMAAAVGAVLAFGIGLLIEYLNNSIRSPSEIMPLLNVPLLGSIAPFGNKRSYKNKLITWTQPRSSISEAYRALRVNLLFRENTDGASSGCRLYVVTSAGPSEGKSVTAANLAITFAITGMRVLLVDADLRRPAVHQVFNLPNTTGLSSIWGSSETAKVKAMAQSVASRGDVRGASEDERISRGMQLYLSHIVQKTEIPGLEVITSGPIPSNPADHLDTIEMRELIHQITDNDYYDAVFFDTPPMLVVADSSIIANVAKAKVILVVESGRTHRPAASRTVQNLTNLSIPVAGVVMNRLRARDRDAEYGYYYYYGYSKYGEAGAPPSSSNGKPSTPQIEPGGKNNE